jgi:hypothetical protein
MEKICMHCGAGIEENGQFGMLEIWEHDPEIHDDGQSHLVGYICAWRTECAKRNIERAYNLAELRNVARDNEHYDQYLCDQARQVVNEFAALSRDIARHNDAAARENGAFAIGGGLG